MKNCWPAIIVFLAVWASTPLLAEAQEPQAQVSSTAPYPLLIGEQEVAQFPAAVDVGSRVCVLTNPGYISEFERLAFKGWSHGPEDLCVTLTAPGSYTAEYVHEVLLTVRSEVREYRESTWVPRGAPVSLTVADTVEVQPGVRYLFEEWTGGESPFRTANTIVPLRPTTLEAKWRKEYLLELVGPEGVDLVGSGWHKERQNVVLKAEATAFASGGGERLQFKEWEAVSNPALVIPNRTLSITSITVDDTHTIRAIYETAYEVVVRNPLGTLKKEWIPEGREVEIDTPASIEVIPEQERLNFKAWEGAELDAPKGFVVVDQPRAIAAVYERQFMVRVQAPYGVSGDGWYPEGETATIVVPEKPSSIVFLSKVFAGYEGYPDAGPTLRVVVAGPLTLSATYHTEFDMRTLGLAIGALIAIGLIYLVSQREYTRRKGRVRR